MGRAGAGSGGRGLPGRGRSHSRPASPDREFLRWVFPGNLLAAKDNAEHSAKDISSGGSPPTTACCRSETPPQSRSAGAAAQRATGARWS